MRLSARLYVEPLDGRRAATRKPVGAPTTLRDDADAPINVQVRDLSGQGCFVETSARPALDSLVSVGLGGAGLVRGAVQRVADDGIGVSFLRELSGPDMAAAFSRPGAVDVARWARTSAAVTDEGRRWPRPVRFVVAVGAGSALWALIAWAIL